MSFILSAGYADGVNGGSTDARAVFQKAQQWLADHPVTVDVPTDAPTAPARASDVPTSVAADQAAITATRESLSAKVADQKTDIALALGEYLTSQGFDAQSIVIDSTQGVYRVGR
ncbi:hypothetical protein [Schumannella soli]|uniref:Uncharacterized protein n=1 Tax=Schumannella soli TaxID=2590779 RepID=A0A506YAA5_9MICO|nr:hypothetical protein [Schumannella soli]TPW78078.1 hypothetical protein FJ657_05480 [Schumannella soli]